MNISTRIADERVAGVRFDGDRLIVDLADGRTIAVPIAWYPRLADATPAQRAHWQVAGAATAPAEAGGVIRGLCKALPDKKLDMCQAMPYRSAVIRSFRSKPLRLFFETDDESKLPVQNGARLRRQLNALDAASAAEQMAIPGWRFHPLKGKPKRYAVDATGNYRLTFGFREEDAIDVNLEDYH